MTSASQFAARSATRNDDASGPKEPMEDRGSYVNHWRKQPDGSWKRHPDAIISAMPTPNADPAAAAAKKK